ncbi:MULTISPECIES: type IV pilus modification PilV family protein [Dyella]|uniref:Prepilin-type N-terminal cleavage/methylation domain-containing protein n=2 Tax=Dyella TaxID=231454 RepID=A0A4R0YIK1_9GAMM|nr:MULTISPECIES: prepilin-type N-terminal cleavage/methylation domain-containing protein [Dyella]TBR36638.1 prepilin-type N-terminal cleavage/methylation domain-containing protein [Dyella terrae]TCI08270.1 prepilin-type N-terminal cleavage/methylation domain-containing protein [Dyella soli]
MPSLRPARGFSLLEVVAAIFLLAIAFTALMQVAGGSMSLSQNAADYTRASMWARTLLDTADVGTDLTPGQSDGRFDDQYRWHLVVAPWRPADVDPGMPSPLQMVKLDLDVRWGAPHRERSAHFSTLRFVQPASNSPGVRGAP